MEFTVNKIEYANGLKDANSVSPSNSHLPILKGIYMNNKKNNSNRFRVGI